MEKIERIKIEGNVIERLPPPVVDRPSLPNLSIPRPVVDIPQVRIDYPVIQVPPSVSAPVPAQPQEAPQEKPKQERSLPQLPAQVFSPPAPVIPPPEKPIQKQFTVELAGYPINLPAPQEVVQASATAIVGTSVTLATALVFNQVRRVVGDAVSKAARNKFKIKLKSVKPVYHFIEEDGGVTILEYSGDGVRTIANHVTDPERFLRDTIETDELFEADHKIIIDEPIKDRFTREGAKRFNYFAPPKKLAKRLTARFALG